MVSSMGSSQGDEEGDDEVVKSVRLVRLIVEIVNSRCAVVYLLPRAELVGSDSARPALDLGTEEWEIGRGWISGSEGC